MDTTRNRTRLFSFLIAGAVAGMLGGAMMAMFTMLATATYLHMGFFTPLYVIASPLSGPQSMMTAMHGGMVYGVLVMLVMSFIVAPIVGAPNFFQLLGWPTWTIGHLLFGMVVGLWPVLRLQDFTGLLGRQARQAA